MNKRELLGMALAAVRHKTSPLFHAVYKERSAEKMLFKVTEIDWDLTSDDNDPEPTNLPEIVVIELNDRYNPKPPLDISLSNEPEYEDIIEDIIEQLSDTHGWCVNNCRITRVE